MDDSLAMTIEALQTSEYYVSTLDKLKNLTLTFTHTLFDYNEINKNMNYHPIDNDSEDKFRDLRIKKVLGKGGFSEVYYAINEVTGEEFAIRLTNINNKTYTLDRAKNEISIYNQLKLVDHKNIAKVFKSKIITTDNSQDLQIIMELGVCSLDIILKNRELNQAYWSEIEILKIAYDLISALALVQTYGLNHRDISLNNIVLSKNLSDYKLIDFGEAIHFSQNMDDMPIVGKIRYLAPEILAIISNWRNRDQQKVIIDYDLEKADVYSLGIVLLSMIHLEHINGSDIKNVTLSLLKIQKSHFRLFTLLNAMLDEEPNKRKRFSNLKMLLDNWNNEISQCVLNELEFVDDIAGLISSDDTNQNNTVVEGDYHMKNGLYKEAIQIYLNIYKTERYIKTRAM